MQSADGVAWERGGQVFSTEDFAIKQDGYSLFGAGDVTVFSPDPENNRFLALVKFANHEAIGPENRQRARAFMFVPSLSERASVKRLTRVDLVPPADGSNGNAPHDEYYSSTAWRYGSHWLGGLKIWHGGGDHPWSAAGCAYFKLVTSRNGLDWEKVPFNNNLGQPEVFLPNGQDGANEGRNDGGYMTEFSSPPLRIGDELILYYGSTSWGKNQPRGIRVTGGGIFRARLRPDGFVSVDSGTLTTRPLQLEGSQLLVNSSGSVDVALFNLKQQRLASATVTGDSLSHRVHFGDKNLRELLQGNACQLEVTVPQGSQLFAFSTKD